MENRFEELRQKLRIEKSVINQDSTGRIYRFLEKAGQDTELTVAFLGGSITQGSLASTPQGCYAYRTYAWMEEHFKAKVNYINAGIGATTSHLGAARVEEDVLSHKPDLVIVEFSVNDEDDSEHFKETYEGLIRKILKADWEPALLLVHNVRYDDGGNAERIHVPVGKHYGLPEISMKQAIYPLLAEDGLNPREITPDDLHPNDLGHALVSDVICHYFEENYRTISENNTENKTQNKTENQATGAEAANLPQPLTKNRYEAVTRYRNGELKPVQCEGFTKDETPQTQVSDCFKKGFMASQINDTICFKGTFSNLAVQYRKTVRKPAPVALAIVDGQEEKAVVLDSNFTEDWGDCLYLETICEDLPYKEHSVEIRLTQAEPEDKECFYLVSLIYA